MDTLVVGKFKEDRYNHGAIAKEIYDFFRGDMNRIARQVFSRDSQGRTCFVLGEAAQSFCIRGAWHRLVDMEPDTWGGPTAGEDAFAQFLGYESAYFLADLNNNDPEAMMNVLAQKIAN